MQVCSQARKKHPAAYCKCYDNFDCFQPAQRNLLHMFTTAPGCVVVLTGDFHFSDIKVCHPYCWRASNVGLGARSLCFDLWAMHMFFRWLETILIRRWTVQLVVSSFSAWIFYSLAQVLQPGNHSYSNDYDSTDLPRPLVQVLPCHIALAYNWFMQVGSMR